MFAVLDPGTDWSLSFTALDTCMCVCPHTCEVSTAVQGL